MTTNGIAITSIYSILAVV